MPQLQRWQSALQPEAVDVLRRAAPEFGELASGQKFARHLELAHVGQLGRSGLDGEALTLRALAGLIEPSHLEQDLPAGLQVVTCESVLDAGPQVGEAAGDVDEAVGGLDDDERARLAVEV